MRKLRGKLRISLIRHKLASITADAGSFFCIMDKLQAQLTGKLLLGDVLHDYITISPLLAAVSTGSSGTTQGLLRLLRLLS
jgi:hypothetical protein